MKTIITTLITLLILFTACGADQDEIFSELPVEVEVLHVSSEIGELMGDSNYVFGAIASALPTEGGGVAVLDLYECDISFFDSTGTFVRSIAGKGEGPGKFLLPLDFVVLEDGRIAVVDLVGRCIDVLSEDGELLNSIDTGNAILPFKMEAIADSTFLIYYYTTDLTEGDFTMGFNLEIWNTSGYQEEIWSWRSEYTGAEFGFSPGYLVCSSSNENIFYAEMSNNQFFIDFINLSTGISGTILGESELIETDSTDTGYIEPKVFVNYSIDETAIDLESEALHYRPQVSSMGTDAENRLWVKNGTANEENWLLYTLSGEFISEGLITGISEPGRLKYVINEHGAIAWAPFTEEHPRVFLLSID